MRILAVHLTPSISGIPVEIKLSSSPLEGYEPRIAPVDVEIERSASCWAWGNRAAAKRGQLVIVNADGGLDAWKDYDWRDAQVIVLAGEEGAAINTFVLWTFGFVDSVRFDDGTIRLDIADPLIRWDKPIQPNLYPDNQANEAIRGTPLPLTFGAPLYCTPVRLDTNPAVRDYQLHDGALTSVTAVYDNGDIFIGPDDPFTPDPIVTAANGGDFGSWSGGVPAGWTAKTPIAATDGFNDAAPGVKCTASYAPANVLQHSVSVTPMARYKIEAEISAATTPGPVTFRIGARESVLDVTAPMVGTTQTLQLYAASASPVEIVTRGDRPANVTIETLRVGKSDSVDWVYYTDSGDKKGITLSNKPAGKITACPTTNRDNIGSIGLWLSTHHPIPSFTDPTTGLPMNVLDIAQFGSLLSVINYKLADYVTNPTMVLDFVARMLDSFSGWIATTRLGQLHAGYIRDVSGDTPALHLDDSVISGLTIELDTAPGLSSRIAGRRNFSPHSDAEIAGSVSEVLREELKAEWLSIREGVTPLATDYDHARDASPHKTILSRDVDVQAEASRITALWANRRFFYRVRCVMESGAADALEPGRVVTVNWPRYGLDGTQKLYVVTVRSRFFSRVVDLVLWG